MSNIFFGSILKDYYTLFFLLPLGSKVAVVYILLHAYHIKTGFSALNSSALRGRTF